VTSDIGYLGNQFLLLNYYDTLHYNTIQQAIVYLWSDSWVYCTDI